MYNIIYIYLSWEPHIYNHSFFFPREIQFSAADYRKLQSSIIAEVSLTSMFQEWAAESTSNIL